MLSAPAVFEPMKNCKHRKSYEDNQQSRKINDFDEGRNVLRIFARICPSRLLHYSPDEWWKCLALNVTIPINHSVPLRATSITTDSKGNGIAIRDVSRGVDGIIVW